MSGEEASLPPLAGGEPELDPLIVASADPGNTARPLDAYAPSDEAMKVVSRARIVVGDKCMARFGFQPMPGWQPEGATPLLTWARYGLWDRAAVDERGYQPPPVPDANPMPARFIPPEAASVYFGEVREYDGQEVPAGGCQGEEIETLYGSEEEFAEAHLAVDLDQEALTRAAQDSRVIKLMPAWRDCMKAAGWGYADVMAPFDYWSTRRGDDKQQPVVSEEEKQSARTDVDCKLSTGLLGTWLASDIAYQQAIVERDGERLREFTLAVDRRVDRANDIIAQG